METLLEILIDYSRSMGPFEYNGKRYFLADGSTRMSLARKALVQDILPALDYAAKVRVRTFYESNGLSISNIYIGSFNKESLYTAIKNLADPKDTGGTPITAALNDSIAYLTGTKNADRKIILVTDGEEDPGGDFIKRVEKAVLEEKINCNVFIVGIGQEPNMIERCKRLAAVTKGGYVNLEKHAYDNVEIKNALRPLAIGAVNSSVTNFQSNAADALNKEKVGDASNKAPDSQSASVANSAALLATVEMHQKSIELLNKQLSIMGEQLTEAKEQQTLLITRLENNLREALNGVESALDGQLQYFNDTNKLQLQQVALECKAVTNNIKSLEATCVKQAQLQLYVDKSATNLIRLMQEVRSQVEALKSFAVIITVLGFLSIALLAYTVFIR